MALLLCFVPGGFGQLQTRASVFYRHLEMFRSGRSGQLQTCEKHISTRRRRRRWQDKRLHTFDVPERLRRFPLILRFLFAGYLLALVAAGAVKSLE